VTDRLDTVRTIEAPEGVELSLRIAGPYPRAIAFVVDFLLQGLLVAAMSLVAILGFDLGQAAVLLTFFFLAWFYPVAFEQFWRGATPGKRALGLRVVRDDGAPVGWRESLLRSFLSPVDALPVLFGVGLCSAIASRSFKRVGDRVAGTVVVYDDEHARSPVLPKAEPMHPPFALTMEEQSALVEFAARTRSWPPARAAEIADHLEPLSEARGTDGVRKLHGMALWIEGQR
jgi:uncharacterized RDD family membrane protein YckC